MLGPEQMEEQGNDMDTSVAEEMPSDPDGLANDEYYGHRTFFQAGAPRIPPSFGQARDSIRSELARIDDQLAAQLSPLATALLLRLRKQIYDKYYEGRRPPSFAVHTERCTGMARSTVNDYLVWLRRLDESAAGTLLDAESTRKKHVSSQDIKRLAQREKQIQVDAAEEYEKGARNMRVALRIAVERQQAATVTALAAGRTKNSCIWTCHYADAPISDESVDLICTDIDWGSAGLAEVDRLVDTCSRVLKPEGVCLVMTGLDSLPTVIAAFARSRRLLYRWTLCYRYREPRRTSGRWLTSWLPVLVLGADRLAPHDVVDETSPRNLSSDDTSQREHPEQKDANAFSELIGWFSKPNDVVFDPFTGGATTGVACMMTSRRFLGTEIEESRARRAQRRVRQAEYIYWGTKEGELQGPVEWITPEEWRRWPSAPKSISTDDIKGEVSLYDSLDLEVIDALEAGRSVEDPELIAALEAAALEAPVPVKL